MFNTGCTAKFYKAEMKKDKWQRKREGVKEARKQLWHRWAGRGPQLCLLPPGHTAGPQSQLSCMWPNSAQGNVSQSGVCHFQAWSLNAVSPSWLSPSCGNREALYQQWQSHRMKESWVIKSKSWSGRMPPTNQEHSWCNQEINFHCVQPLRFSGLSVVQWPGLPVPIEIP